LPEPGILSRLLVGIWLPRRLETWRGVVCHLQTLGDSWPSGLNLRWAGGIARISGYTKARRPLAKGARVSRDSDVAPVDLAIINANFGQGLPLGRRRGESFSQLARNEIMVLTGRAVVDGHCPGRARLVLLSLMPVDVAE